MNDRASLPTACCASPDRPTRSVPRSFRRTAVWDATPGITHSYAALDMRLMRSIRFGERVRLDLIAEGFNLFNRFNEAAAAPFFTAVNDFDQRASNGRFYSRPTASYDPRQFQFGVKLNF